jgi:membrane associated rhomboid family serine protease
MNELIEGVPNVMLIIGGPVFLMWFLYFLDSARGGKMSEKYSLYPFRADKPSFAANRFISFFTYPFFHGSFSHLMGNTWPFIIAAWFVLLAGERNFFVVTPIIMAVSGIGISFFGKVRVIGMSGVNLGYFSYVISIGLFTRNVAFVVFGGIFLMLTILFLEAPGIYQGSTIWRNIWPTDPKTSRSAHFFGFLGGFFAAYVMSLIYANEFNL